MKRRDVLVAGGTLGGLGLAGHLFGRRTEGVTVSVWFSRQAADYSDLRERIREYLSRALGDIRDPVRIDFDGEPVALPAEEGREVLAGQWPRMVIEGAVGGGAIEGISDVNVLVTDGDPRKEPAGYGMRSIAAVTGARYLDRMPPIDRESAVVDYSVPAAITQLLLHECGHAIGFEHRHGAVVEDGDAVIASPMVGAYAWSDAAPSERLRRRDGNACGRSYPDPDGKDRRLSLRYSPCIRKAIRR